MLRRDGGSELSSPISDAGRLRSSGSIRSISVTALSRTDCRSGPRPCGPISCHCSRAGPCSISAPGTATTPFSRSAAERPVVALDHYVWGVDIAAREQYWNECRELGTLPDHGRDPTDFWRPDLPGRRGFELAKEVLDSNVEPVVADFATVDLDSVGTFDVVLYLGVLYHMKEPLRCLERLRGVTREVAVIETAAICIPSAVGHAPGPVSRRLRAQPRLRQLVPAEHRGARGPRHRGRVLANGSDPGTADASSRKRRDGVRVASLPDARPRDYRAIIHAYV